MFLCPCMKHGDKHHGICHKSNRFWVILLVSPSRMRLAAAERTGLPRGRDQTRQTMAEWASADSSRNPKGSSLSSCVFCSPSFLTPSSSSSPSQPRKISASSPPTHLTPIPPSILLPRLLYSHLPAPCVTLSAPFSRRPTVACSCILFATLCGDIRRPTAVQNAPCLVVSPSHLGDDIKKPRPHASLTPLPEACLPPSTRNVPSWLPV